MDCKNGALIFQKYVQKRRRQCPVRDTMLIENRCSQKAERAVRHAMSHGVLRPYGTFREGVVTFFYQHLIPNGILVLSKAEVKGTNICHFY